MVTIKDISKISGFSVTTVSKALNNYTDISNATRDKIISICEEVGYVPNSSARSLKTHRSYTIGIVFEEETNQGLQHPLFSKILERFKSDVEAAGYDIMFLARSIGKQNGSYLQHSKRKQVEGVLVLCADFNSSEILELAASDIPTTVIDFAVENTINITSQNDQAVKTAIDYLVDLGHKKIAHIYGDRYSFIGGQRKRSFEEALKAQGLPVEESYLVSGEFFSRQEGYDAMNELLRLEDRPSAVFCASDMLAIGAIQAIKDASMRVPEDISVIGFDGIDLGQLITPRLTTIKQDTEEMGLLAAKHLIELIENKDRPKSFETINVPTALIVGESTKKIN